MAITDIVYAASIDVCLDLNGRLSSIALTTRVNRLSSGNHLRRKALSNYILATANPTGWSRLQAERKYAYTPQCGAAGDLVSADILVYWKFSLCGVAIVAELV